MKARRMHSRLATALLAAVVAVAAGPAQAGRGADSAQRFKDDVRFLGGKLVPAKYRLRGRAGGEDAFAELQRQLEELKGLIGRLEEVGGQIDASESRLRYQKIFEVEPKYREVERVQLWAEQRAKEFADRLERLRREGELAGARPHNGQTEATCTTCQAVAAIKARFEAAQTAAQKFMAEAQREIERAIAAWQKAEQESVETGGRHRKQAEEFADVAGQYGSARGPLAQRLEEIENEPVAVGGLTPFPQGSVPPGEVGLVARPAPIGAGVSPRALDQLRIVTASSVAAAGTKDDHLNVGPVTTGMVSGYQFDTTLGLPPVELPEVDAPGGVAAEPAVPEPAPGAVVPLVIEPSPTARPGAPPALKESPRLQQAEVHQTELFGRLEQLYAERKELARQGGAARPENWTQVVNRISETQAQINFAEATKRMSAGSAPMDLTLRTKSRGTSDIVVPPPDNQ